MFRQLKKNLVATLIAALTIGQVAPAFADTADTLPDMGTSAGSTLSGLARRLGKNALHLLFD